MSNRTGKLCDMEITMELERLESLAEESKRIYDGINRSRALRGRKLILAYQGNVSQLKYLKEYRKERW